MNNKYLVPAEPFIGSYFVDALIARGDDVTVVDNLSTGERKNINPQATSGSRHPRPPKILPHFTDINGVFTAARARVQPSITDPLEPNDINIAGTLNVLWAAKRTALSA